MPLRRQMPSRLVQPNMTKTATKPPADSQPIDAAALLHWYDRHARDLPWRVSPADRTSGVLPDPYSVWLSEIMLQQTTVATVGAYFRRFIVRWPNVRAMAAAPLDDVLAEWAGLGYYARARNLHACAQKIVDEHNGRFPTSAIELQELPGIGPYTSAAIAAICFDEQVAVIDGNVDRVMARYLALNVPVRDAKPQIRAEVQKAVPARAGDFAQAMMDLGASLCAPRAASCLLCPIAVGCEGTATGQPTDFPIKPVKPERPVRYGHAFIIANASGEIWLRQRPEKGLLAKMTEVPGSGWGDSEEKPTFPFKDDWRQRGHVNHVFTHFRLELTVWHLNVEMEKPIASGWWSAPDQLAGEALPSLYRKVLATVTDDAQKKTAGSNEPAVK